jgi:hypothetical protein
MICVPQELKHGVRMRATTSHIRAQLLLLAFFKSIEMSLSRSRGDSCAHSCPQQVVDVKPEK